MKVILARWLLLKGKRFKLLSSMLLPLIVTIVITSIYHYTSDDFRVPVAVVVEEDAEVTSIIEGLKDADYIKLDVYDDINEPLRNLEQYQYDSLFVFDADFNEKLQNNERRNIIESYYTDRSFTYDAVKELIASLVQEEVGQYRLSQQVQTLQEDWLGENNLSFNDIVDTKKEIEEETNLVNQKFNFQGQVMEESPESSLNPLLIYGYAVLIFAFFTFDFVTRETNSETKHRFLYLSVSYKTFMLVSFLSLTILMYGFDIISYFILIDSQTNLLVLLTYRLVINAFVFFTVFLSRSILSLYVNSLIIFILLLVTQFLLSIIRLPNGLTLLASFHPVEELVSNQHNIYLVALVLIIFFIWLRRDNLVRS